MTDRATFIARIEAAIAYALDALEEAEEKASNHEPDVECIHLEGHVAGLRQALNLLKEKA